MMLTDQGCPAGRCQDADKARDESRALAAKWHGAEGGRLSYAFSPRTPVACSERIMRGAAALSEMLKCYVQTHLAESLALTRAARESFPDRVDELDVFADFGLLTPRTLLGHGVFLSQQQRQQVARSKTAVVHCPTANLFLESG
jgi:guanine deaminase